MQAILPIQPPKNVSELRHFLGMVQYYRDLWARQSKMLAPLTSLVGECSQTKDIRAKETKKAPWHWDEVHRKAFNLVKATIAREVVLAYPDYSKVFEIYTDASSKQLGAVITRENRPIAFFSQKLSTTQHKYSVTKIELLAIVETLKEGNVPRVTLGSVLAGFSVKKRSCFSLSRRVLTILDDGVRPHGH